MKEVPCPSGERARLYNIKRTKGQKAFSVNDCDGSYTRIATRTSESSSGVPIWLLNCGNCGLKNVVEGPPVTTELSFSLRGLKSELCMKGRVDS